MENLIKVFKKGGLITMKKVKFYFAIVLTITVSACSESMFQDDNINDDLNLLSQSLENKFGKIGISDAANEGIDEFYFLSPTVTKNPKFSGKFHPNLPTVVEISDDFEFKRIHQVFTREDPANKITVSEEDERYVVIWDTFKSKAEKGKIYRVRVRIGEKEMGFVDVAIVPNASSKLKNNLITVVQNETLRIVYRLEDKTCPARIKVLPEYVKAYLGQEIQFKAVVYNFYGEILENQKINWSVYNEDVASVNQNGIVVGKMPRGETSIHAKSFEVLGYGVISIKEIFGIVFDIEGNEYTMDRIGDEIWLLENLKTTRYNDGTPILTRLSPEEWGSIKEGAYSDYDDNPANGKFYGRLYNEFAIRTGKLCPVGWHVADLYEYGLMTDILTEFPDNISGSALKSKIGWAAYHKATNETGFSALPSGRRIMIDEIYRFDKLGELTGWWMTESNQFTNSPKNQVIQLGWHEDTGLYERSFNDGYCVRCVRDE